MTFISIWIDKKLIEVISHRVAPKIWSFSLTNMRTTLRHNGAFLKSRYYLLSYLVDLMMHFLKFWNFHKSFFKNLLLKSVVYENPSATSKRLWPHCLRPSRTRRTQLHCLKYRNHNETWSQSESCQLVYSILGKSRPVQLAK